MLDKATLDSLQTYTNNKYNILKDSASFIAELIPYFLAIAGIALLLYIIWGGFSLMISQGDPKGIESGKQKITNGLIGFIVVFCAYWIVQILAKVLGLNAITNIFP